MNKKYINKKKSPFYLVLFIKFIWVLLFLANYSTAMGDEGKKTYKTKYVNVHYIKKKDLNKFSRKLEGAEVFGFLKKKDSSSLKSKLDVMVERVKDILDMHPPKLKFSIDLHAKYKDVKKKFKKLNLKGKTPIAFYRHKTRTITVSLVDITDHILAHEMAHAVISTYFGVAPPGKMQEILARHVDLHLWR